MNEGDFEFGGYLTGKSEPVFVSDFSPGAADWRVQDALSPVGDNRYFGRDHISGREWAFTLAVNAKDQSDALALLSDLVRIFQSGRKTPGAESVVRYRVGGRSRRVYGRFRGFVPAQSRSLAVGRAVGAAAFLTSDPLHYADEAQSVTVTLLPGESGSYPLPATLPFTFVQGGPRSGLISDVGGDADAPVEIVIHGPVVNPSVMVDGHRVALAHTLAYDEWVTVDTRKMTVVQNNGASMAGKLSRRTFLADVRLSPGPAEIIFEGSDETGTSTCTVTWRSAYHGF